LNGTKRYITNAPHAGLFTVFARTDANTANSSGVTAFLVEAGTPGLSLGKPDKKMGQKGSHTCDVILEDVRVPVDAIIGGPARADCFRPRCCVLRFCRTGGGVSARSGN
jgi:acyl-CoA dehydrogenase